MTRPRSSVTALALGLLLSCSAVSWATGVDGVSKAFRRVAGYASLVPRFDAGRLPGHTVGVLQWDPNAGPGQRLVLWAGGHVWGTLFVPDPQDKTPSKFPLGNGGALELVGGVRLLQLTDVPVATLPAVVTVTVNQGHGARGTNAILVDCQPVGKATWNLPLAPLVSACTQDWLAHAATLAPAPDAQDVVLTGWDDSQRRVEVVILRKHRNRITRTTDRTDPMVVRRGKPLAVARYEIDTHGRVVEKVVAGAP